MELKNLLIQKRASILERWFNVVIKSYPADTVKFLKKTKDRFANPVGHTISTELGAIFDDLVGETQAGGASEFLERIIKVRAVQGFSPSQAVSFIFLLKGVIRKEIEDDLDVQVSPKELNSLESRIDQLGFTAFDIYVKKREKLYEMRVKEAKAHSSRLLERAETMFRKIREAKKEEDVNNDGLAP